MPEYLAPGVFVAEAALPGAIAGVPTAITGLVGLAAAGPAGIAMPAASVAEYERAFCAGDDGHLALAVRLFFANGGQRLHVVRAATADAAGYLAGLAALAPIEEIALVAAPGAAALPEPEAIVVQAGLVAQAEALRDRLAILAGPETADTAGIRAVRARHDSSHAALYHPWVVVEGADGTPRATGPEGAVAGICARSDAARGVHASPANEMVRGIAALVQEGGRAREEVLNPEGINVIRSFEGRGIRLWGARTMSSDPEFRQIATRRLCLFIEASLARGTRWVALEPQGEALWQRLRDAVERFLFDLWKAGALRGDRPQEAFFVRCDRSTMTEEDLAAGRLVCLVGVAVVTPGEFVLLRLGQRTAGAAG